MIVFWRLLFGHMVADFTIQTNFINTWKRKSTWGMLTHCATHPVLYVLLCHRYLNDFWIDTALVRLQGWTCILLIFILHYMEDEWRVFTIYRYKTPDNTLYFLWDQVIHYLCVFSFLPLGLFEYGSSGFMPEKWPVLGCLGVIVTHFCTVLVYFLEKDLFQAVYPAFDEKYLLMAARLVLTLCFLLPSQGWFLVALGWAGVVVYVRYRRLVDFSWFSLYIGGLCSVLAGTAARWVYYR